LADMVRLPRAFQFLTPAIAWLVLAAFLSPQPCTAQVKPTTWTTQEKPIADTILSLRQLPDDIRARTTKDLALQIRQLPAASNKVQLAFDLASLSTEGDFGQTAQQELATLQEVATTLAASLHEKPVRAKSGQIAPPYIELAQLTRYEHVQVSLDDPQFAAALAKMQTDDARREDANFTLTDRQGKTWTLKSLSGKVVLVNFWATWCPPCNKEIPDLEALYERFKDQGFVILAISDEEANKVDPFIAKRNVTYPVLLDPGRKINDLFQVEGIPKSFVYDRSGKLVAQSIDMRTQKQFLEMLAQADLH
jgi:peroxiredoxin